MKNQINYFSVLIILLSMILTSCTEDKIIAESELPTEISSYLKMHFPNNMVVQATMDKELFSTSYDVILSDNISLEFNSKNNIKDIDAASKLPDSVIPKEILDYVKSNYANNHITDWELDDNNQQIGLDNGIDLEFNMKGKFLRIDN